MQLSLNTSNPIAILQRLSERTFLLLLFGVVFFVGLYLSLPSLSYYWFSDDLQQVRLYSNQELIDGLVGDYDPTGMATPGWRPLNRIIYHVQSLLFGNVFALHRLFNIAMFALHVTILMILARRLGFSRLMVLVAGLIYACTKNTWWMMVWPTNGLRNFMGMCSSLAIYFLIDYLASPSRRKYVLSFVFYALALFNREEVLFLAAIIPAVGLLFLLQKDRIVAQPLRWLRVTGLRTLIIHTVVIGIMTGGYLIGRAYFVPRVAILGRLNPEGWLFNVIAVLFPHLPAPSLLASGVLIGLFWIALIYMLFKIDREQCLIAVFWLGCVVIGGTPGLSSWRADNLLVPIGFYTLFLVTVLINFAKQSRRAAGFCAIVLVYFMVGSGVQHQLAQESIHPYSLYYLDATRLYMWGKYSPESVVYVPQDRRDHLWAQYRALGIDTPARFDALYPQIEHEALDAGRVHPDGEQVFAPVYPNYLHPW